MIFKIVKFLALFFLCFNAGCGSNWWGGHHNHSNFKTMDSIDSHYGTIRLINSHFKVVSGNGPFKVRYEKRLEKQAESIVEILNQTFTHIHNLTGVEPAISGYTYYLITCYGSIYHLPVVLDYTSGNGCNILFVNNSDPSVERTLSEHASFPFPFYHELVESTLLSKRIINVKDSFLDWEKKPNYNLSNGVISARWFREGFSDYCGWLAIESVISSNKFDPEKVPNVKLFNGCPIYPFSSLAKIKSDLFLWNQTSEYPQRPLTFKPYNYYSVSDFYDASFALFLLLRDKFGDDTVRDILDEIKMLKVSDGSGVLKAFNSVLEVDLRKFVEDFSFPETGLYVKIIWDKNDEPQRAMLVNFVEHESLAEKAGIKKDDLVLRINDIPVESFIDFELALYKLMDNDSVTVHLRREGVGEIALDLKLWEK